MIRKMIIGREKELHRLKQNLLRGVHTVIYGLAGSGKTALLRELSSMLQIDGRPIVYVNHCKSRRDLLQEALTGFSQTGRMHLSVRSLRDELLAVCVRRNPCLLLDHAPLRIPHRMQRLFELLEERSTLVFSVTAVPVVSDLYYWKHESIEISSLSRKAAVEWIVSELGSLGYGNPLRNALAAEIFRFAAGNPGAISRTLAAIENQARQIDDPIRIGRMFLEGQISAETFCREKSGRPKRMSGT